MALRIVNRLTCVSRSPIAATTAAGNMAAAGRLAIRPIKPSTTTPTLTSTTPTSGAGMCMMSTASGVLGGVMPVKSAYGLSRRPDFSEVSAADVTFFQSIVGDDNVITDDQRLKAMNGDWMRKYRGYSKLALRPATVEQVSQILKYCNQRKLAVVPQGGNTGLVGGSVPLFDEIIVSTSRMNKVISFDEHSGVITAEAGCVLESLDNYLRDRGYIMPLDLGAKGSCQIGGNVSTNAGGLRLVRYGSLRGNVLGLQVVLADGTIVDNLSTLRKDNTGYDMKQMFIGSEGTLGLITKVAILTPRKSKSVQVAFVGITSYEKLLQTLAKARSQLSDIISAVEFVDRHCLDMVLENIKGSRDPLSAPTPFYMLIETSGNVAEHDLAKLTGFLEEAMEEKLIVDGTVADSEAQQRSLWQLRESAAEALSRAGTVYKYDISLPLNVMYDFVTDMRARIGSRGRVVGYGHLGDSNLHLNVSTPKPDPTVFALIEPYIFEQTAKHNGSVSAEHGIGQSKPGYLHFSKSQQLIRAMRQQKDLFDPNGILNPYKVLPPASVSS